VEHPAQGNAVTLATTTAALALAAVSGGFSISGMTAVFVGAFWPVVCMGAALELGKLSAVAWLGLRRGSRPLRVALGVLVSVLMALNAIGAYGFWRKRTSAIRSRATWQSPTGRPTSKHALLSKRAW
jgi:hypothetical protein